MDVQMLISASKEDGNKEAAFGYLDKHLLEHNARVMTFPKPSAVCHLPQDQPLSSSLYCLSSVRNSRRWTRGLSERTSYCTTDG